MDGVFHNHRTDIRAGTENPEGAAVGHGAGEAGQGWSLEVSKSQQEEPGSEERPRTVSQIGPRWSYD